MDSKSIQNKLLKKYVILLSGFVIISVFLVNTLMLGSTAMFAPKPAPVTIVYDPTDATLVTTATSLQNYLESFTAVNMVPIYKINNLLAFIQKASNPMVYVFHGNQLGWKVGQNFVGNNVIASAVQKSNSPAHFFVACYSDTLATMINNKYVGNLFGTTDALVGVVLMEEQLLTYFSNHGLQPAQFTTLNSKLRTYIKTNANTILSRLIHPVKPLRLILPSCQTDSVTTYDSSYYGGPTGFYVTSNTNSASSPNSALQSAVNAANDLISVLNSVPGLDLTISIVKHSIVGNAVYTYDTANCISNVMYITYYSDVNYNVAFNWMTFSTHVAFSDSADNPNAEGHSASISVLGVTLEVDLEAGVPTLTSNGNLGYTTGVSYTYSPTTSTLQSITNSWINNNKPTTGWVFNLWVQLGNSYDVKGKVSYDGHSVSFTVGSIFLGGRIYFSTDASGNIIVGGAAFATAESNPSLSLPIIGTIVGVDLKLIIVGLGVQGQWSSGVFTSASYFGFKFAGSLTVTGATANYNKIWTYTFQNNLGISANTLITNLYNTQF